MPSGELQTEARAAGARAWVLTPLGMLRTAVAGLLMGMANLIPGVSGGTMILAMGVYEEFIAGVAEVTALQLSVRRVVFLGVLGLFAAGAILGLAGVILFLLFHFPVAMYALFIGLTLGGAPLLLASLRPVRADVVVATAAGFALMMGVFLLKGRAGLPHNALMDFVSGLVGATTMVLPGISGSYMLLVMDQYERVVGAVHDRDLGIIVVVGVGAVLGVVGLSNALKYLLRHYHRVTVGALLGILLGSVVGLWPFGRPVKREALEQRSVAELQAFVLEQRIPDAAGLSKREALVEHILANWERRGASDYTPGRIAEALLFALLGFASTFGLSRLGETGRLEPIPRPLGAVGMCNSDERSR